MFKTHTDWMKLGGPKYLPIEDLSHSQEFQRKSETTKMINRQYRESTWHTKLALNEGNLMENTILVKSTFLLLWRFFGDMHKKLTFHLRCLETE